MDIGKKIICQKFAILLVVIMQSKMVSGEKILLIPK